MMINLLPKDITVEIKIQNFPTNNTEPRSGFRLAFIIVSFSFLGVTILTILICFWVRKRWNLKKTELETRPDQKQLEMMEK